MDWVFTLSIIKSMVGSIWRRLTPQLDQPAICQAIVLLFPRIHGVRHQFFTRINSVDCMMDSSEKTLARV